VLVATITHVAEICLREMLATRRKKMHNSLRKQVWTGKYYPQ